MKGRWILPLFALVFGVSSCGYHIQDSANPLAERGIRRIFVGPIRNSTYKPGVENVVFNALIRTFGHHQRVKLVLSREDADAELIGSVSSANYSNFATTSAAQLTPLGQGPNDVSVSTIYTADLGCTFSLIQLERKPSEKRIEVSHGTKLWEAGFSRNKRFPANTQLGVPGTTSALINESEFERAISDLADSMMEDVHESFLAQF